MMNKILWIDSRMRWKSPLVTVGANNYLAFKRKYLGKYDAVMFTMPYLKVLITVCFHKIFKQPTNLTPFLQVFL